MRNACCPLLVVTLQEIAENDFNLNIPRYVDAGPPEEPLLDVRAALFGGVPRHEVEAEEPRFHSFDIDHGGPTGRTTSGAWSTAASPE
ncbi:hypothetical protein [Streptomyces sp. NPDC093111]|uniref:hypothetical protein n=1 Tax=Streptomyces sp. NPDC093111 TaxID=3154978 RepID=UPI003447F76F